MKALTLKTVTFESINFWNCKLLKVLTFDNVNFFSKVWDCKLLKTITVEKFKSAIFIQISMQSFVVHNVSKRNFETKYLFVIKALNLFCSKKKQFCCLWFWGQGSTRCLGLFWQRRVFMWKITSPLMGPFTRGFF